MARSQEGYLSAKTWEQHAEKKNHIGLGCDRINLEDASLSDSMTKEYYFCD